jgi:hypothetical protein
MELRTRTVVWIAITASGVIGYVLTISTDIPAVVRYVAGWYTILVACLLFAVVGITLSVKFGEYGRLDSAHGWLLRAFLFW